MKKTKFLIKWPLLRAHQKQRIYKFILILFENYGFSYLTLKEKRGQEAAISIPVRYKSCLKSVIKFLHINKYILGISALLLFSLNSATAAPTCPPWLNIYDGDKQETITPRVLPNVNADGNVQYETCKQATDRREGEVQRRHANRNANQNITGGSRDNCIFREPLPPFTEHKVEVRQVRENPDGTPVYESCRNAQWRKQEEWRKSEGWEHREDLEDEIAKYNAGEDKKVLSAAEEAEEAAKKQEKASLITTAGAMAAGAAAAICCSKTPICSACPYLVALSAGLGIAGIGLMLASDDNKGISADYAGNLLNDPNSTSGGGGGGLTGTTGNITAGTTSGMPTPPNVSLPVVKLPNGDTVVPTPENLGPYLKKHNLKWDPKNKKITLPDGRSYTADDLDNPELRQYANSGPVANLKNQMKDMEKQIAGNMEDGATDSLADDASEEDGLGGAGGGGFAGYDGGRSGSGGGGGTLMAGLNRTPGSKDGSSKVAGMSVKMGKNQVGVRQDNIFEMIHRRYQNKRKRKQFIEIKF